MKSRSHQLLNRSLSAILSAIEIYNKPLFEYREELFAILVINAWELLLKARILQIDQNRLSSILEYERRRKANGKLSDKYYRKKNRSGNHLSINLFKAFDRLTNDYGDKLDKTVRLNLEALTEIRDNSVHFMNDDFLIKKKIYELGTANLKNYLNTTRTWFGKDLGKYSLFLMPIAFLSDIPSVKSVNLNSEEKNVLNYFKKLQRKVKDDVTKDYNLTLAIDIKFRKIADPASVANVTITNSPEALPITLEEEDIRDKYPWDYNILTQRLRNRYEDFKVAQKYHQLRKKLENNPNYCNTRLLDPGNPKSQKKNFFNPNILKEFDKIFTRKKIKV